MSTASPMFAPIVGPFLRFGNYDPITREYTASVLIVVNPMLRAEPTLTYDSTLGGSNVAPKVLLDTYSRFTFWRFDLSIPLILHQRTVTYHICCDGEQLSATFHVPGASQPWHWAFYSCNGFHAPKEAVELDGIQPLWKDFNKLHREQAFHVQVGGGDQLYNDPVWDILPLERWLKHDKEARLMIDPDEEMTSETESFYFTHYCKHFSEPEFKQALASVPYVFTWDDHDIFDGYGSYPDKLQNCAVFNMVYAAAKRFYLLFQQHATPATIRKLNNTFGVKGFNEIKRFGSSLALWSMDSRSERCINTILADDTHTMAKQKLLKLGPEVRHVIVVAAVPLVYPELPAEAAFQGVQKRTGFFGFLGNSGLLNMTGTLGDNQFGEPDLLDDIIDHWTASSHVEERTRLIQNMQEVAQQKSVRVTFISGDVHSMGIGRFYSYPKHAEALHIGGEECEDFRDDFRFMPNITSSSIGNTPMPVGLCNTYNKLNSAANVPSLPPTREKMVRRFHGNTEKVLGRRNYCVVTELPYNPRNSGIENGAIDFCLRAENRKKNGQIDMWHNWVCILTSKVDPWAGSSVTIPVPRSETED